VIQCDSMITSAGGEAALKRGKGGDDAVGMMRILLGKKIKKINTVDSATTNG
jgi:hypothetical protein